MKKTRTSNMLLFSSLAVILCTTAKASEDKENITTNSHLRHQEALAHFEKGINKLKNRFKAIFNQQKKQTEIDCKIFLSELLKNPAAMLRPCPTHQNQFAENFLFCFLKNSSDQED